MSSRTPPLPPLRFGGGGGDAPRGGMGISGGRAPHGKRGWGSSKPGCWVQDAVQPVSANVMVKPPCAVSDVVPPCVGARIATSAGVRFRTICSVDGPDLGTRQRQCLGGVAPLLIYYLFCVTSSRLPRRRHYTSRRRQGAALAFDAE